MLPTPTATSSSSVSATAELENLLTLPPPGWTPPLAASSSSSQQQQQLGMFIAHAALQALRESGDEQFLFLRTMIETLQQQQQQQQQIEQAMNHTTNSNHQNVVPEELLFHCITGCRHAMLIRWTTLSPCFRATLRNFFMMLGQDTNTLPSQQQQQQQQPRFTSRTLQLACYTTCACFWKRDWKGENSSNNSHHDGDDEALLSVPDLMTTTTTTETTTITASHHPQQQQQQQNQMLLETMIRQLMPQLPPVHTQQDLMNYWKSIMIPSLPLPTTTTPPSATDTNTSLMSTASAATFLTLLIGEFVGKSRVPYQMPLEFHRQAHARFEQDGWLDICLDMNLTALGQVLNLVLQQSTITATTTTALDTQLLATGLANLTCLNDVINWEFGSDAWESLGMYQQLQQQQSSINGGGTSKTLIRPPVRWRNALLQPELWQGLLSQVYPHMIIHMTTSANTNVELGHRFIHALSELILALASIQGSIWPNDQHHRRLLCSYLVQGTLQLLTTTLSSHLPLQQQYPSELTQQVWLDALALVNRIIVNFQWSTLSQLPGTAATTTSNNNNTTTTVTISPLIQLVQAIADVSTSSWQAHVSECEAAQGDRESMEYSEWREEVLSTLLDGLVLLVAGGAVDQHYQHNMRQTPSSSGASSSSSPSWALAEAMGSIYSSFVMGRIRIAQWEEQYVIVSEQNGDQRDVIHDHQAMVQREEISQVDLQEEMTSVATIGRWHLGAALFCLSSLASTLFPQLQALWTETTTTITEDVSPQAAALLEGVRLWSMSLGHLITDDNTGETPIIPEAIISACQEQDPSNGTAAITVQALVSAMQMLRSIAEEQVSKLMVNPHDPRLSPLLATSLLWTLQRWAPAYILPVDWGTGRPLDYSAPAASKRSSVLAIWSGPEQSQQAVTFCLGLCLRYQCYWPQERQVQENASLLLMSLAKRAELRPLMVQSPALHQLVTLHCLTAGLRHGAPTSELEAAIRAKLGNHSNGANTAPPREMIYGYQRLPYKDRSRILTSILLACSDPQDAAANVMWNESLKAVGEAFQSLVQALSSKQVTPSDVHAREMTCLCVEMFRGVARSSEITDPERIAQYITPTLRPWSGFMPHYAQDLTVCEGLLGFFRDYAEQFVAFLNREQCLVLFETSADLLKAYGSVQSGASTGVPRSIRTPSVETALKEEQSYNDVLCAIELLIHLGTKDFLDLGNNSTNVPIGQQQPGGSGIESRQVTDIIFFGLQQIIPLMTQGLLQYPTLCTQYFSLVGFMMDTYQEQVSALPFDLFHALIESLLWGMSHHDAFVSKSCLQGIGSLVREHLKSGRVMLHRHVVQRPDLFDQWNQRLVQDVVLQPIVWDRLEPAGMALLPLAAVDVDRFAAVMRELTLGGQQQQLQEQYAYQHQQQQSVTMNSQIKSQRVQGAIQRLLQPDVVSKVGHGGYEGRMNRIRFKKDFEVFVQEIHSFLVLA